MNNQLHFNKKYKDSVFRMLFGYNREYALSLARAITGVNYPDDVDLQFQTIGKMIYMSIQNDVSFAILDKLFMFEHQSSINKNMPLRILQYYIQNINSIVVDNESLHRSSLIQIPTPMCYTFCNAVAMQEEREELRLSDAFKDQESAKSCGCEWTVHVININYGKNAELMDACEALKGYSVFVDKARKWQKVLPGVDGMDRAIEECISEGYLVDFLRKHYSEVRDVSLEEFDVEKYINYERADSREDGVAEGIAIGREEGRSQERNDMMSIMGTIKDAVIRGVYDCANIAVQFGRSASEIEAIRNMMIL